MTTKEHQNVLRRLYRDRKQMTDYLKSRKRKWRANAEYRLGLIDKLIAWRKEDIKLSKGESNASKLSKVRQA